MPWGIDESTKEGIVTKDQVELRAAIRRVKQIKETVEMQKIRDRIKNLMLSGRGKMVDPKYNDLKKQIILHCKPEEKEQIIHQVER
jgi:hypothetical protein